MRRPYEVVVVFFTILMLAFGAPSKHREADGPVQIPPALESLVLLLTLGVVLVCVGKHTKKRLRAVKPPKLQRSESSDESVEEFDDDDKDPDFSYGSPYKETSTETGSECDYVPPTPQKVNMKTFPCVLSLDYNRKKKSKAVTAQEILEELDLVKKCRRFSGTSGGAVVAALLATGHSAEEVKIAVDLPAEELIYDSCCGCLSFLPNMLNKFGWNPAKKFHAAARQLMQNKTGDPDITFAEVYRRYGNELCIVATNVTTSCPEYFHMKTTPNMSVAQAMHCSSAIPVLIQPVKVELEDGMTQLFVDGGLVDSYPLHAYDGWYLSSNKEDSFFHRLENSEHPFGTSEQYNKKSLGFTLFDLWNKEFGTDEFLKRRPLPGLRRPHTKLKRENQKEADRLIAEYLNLTSTLANGKLFMKILHDMLEDEQDSFTYNDFVQAYLRMKKEYPDETKKLFSETLDIGVIKKRINARGGRISMDNFISILQKEGINWTQLLNGSSPFQPTSMTDYFKILLNTSVQMTRNVHQKPCDIHRTAGIFTDYVGTTDFDLEPQDVDFLIREGEVGAIQYLHQLVQQYENNELTAMEGVVTRKEPTQTYTDG